jgi:flagellar hook protein FlgE
MTLLSSLFAGVSGLNSAGNAISVIGDNIANSQTTGFKASRVEFTDVLSQSIGGGGSVGQIGAGSRLAGVTNDFGQGSLETTGVTTDLGIDGSGFFIVQDTTGVFHSRAGVFRLNNQQVLVNNIGQSVLGFGVTNNVPNGALGAIDLSTVSSQPQPTAAVTVNINLDPNDTVIPALTPFDHTNPVTTSNFQTGIRVFDSLGNPRDLTIYFRKSTVANEWFFYAGANRSDINFAAYGAPFNTFGNTPADQFVPLQSGTLTFTTGGLLSAESTTALNLAYDANGNGAISAAEAAAPVATPANAAGFSFTGGSATGQALTFDFGLSIAQGGSGSDQTTQFGGVAASGVNNFVRFTSQDGFTAGSLQAINVNEDGFVEGLFSNGQTVRLAQVALATFANINGLSRIGNNNFAQTINSGNAIIGSPNQGSFGAIRSGFLELSNTDLADQFVDLILSQRAFQANTRTISTTNELLAALVVLGQ